MSELREPISIRLVPAEKAFLLAKADEAGLEGGTAARQLVELAIKYMRATGADYIDTLQIVKNALRPVVLDSVWEAFKKVKANRAATPREDE